MTPNFSLEELTRSSFAIINGIDNSPNDLQLRNLKIGALILEFVRKELGGFPILVCSGFRCPAVNIGVGGVSSSSHLDGLAFDIIVNNGKTNVENGVSIARLDFAFDQIIIYKSFIHLGLGERARKQVINKL